MKLTLRDLLWFILVVAIGLAWYRADRQRLAELESARARFEKWRAEFSAETAEIINMYSVAARHPGAYQDWMKHTEEERAKARQAIAQQLGTDNAKP